VAGAVVLATCGTAAFLVLLLQVDSATRDHIFRYDDPRVGHHHVALVFGAGLNAQGGPSQVLYDRVATAVDLYRAHKVDKLLMTGDNGTNDYNEVGAMLRTAQDLGVPEPDIVLDYAGFHTYDSCYRAHAIFGLSEATLVTNAYHLPRALYTCAQLGVAGEGVVADRQHAATWQEELRELPALAVSQWQEWAGRPPRFLGPPVDVDVPQAH